MYKAIVTRIEVTPHPNADLIAVGHVAGHTIVVSKTTNSGDLGIFFPSDGQLSHDFCNANDLYPRVTEAGERAGGFFDPKNRRVRAQSFRGVKSEGFWIPIESLRKLYVEEDKLTAFLLAVTSLKEGDTFDELGGIRICEKYYTPATQRMRQGGGGGDRIRVEHPLFLKHVDTEQLKYGISSIPKGSIITITEKLHGTSGRYTYLKEEDKAPAFSGISKYLYKLAIWLLGVLGIKDNLIFSKMSLIIGSRNVQLQGKTADSYRTVFSENLRGKLHENEIVYGEFVGWGAPESPIMGRHFTDKLKDPKFQKQYGKVIIYSYGCSPEHPWDFYTYRIARVSEDGSLVELSFPQLKARSKELDLKVVPEFDTFMYDGSRESLEQRIDPFIEGSSTLDEKHIREGIVIRVDSPDGRTKFLKEKSFAFKVLEGIAKDDADYVDTEEIS